MRVYSRDGVSVGGIPVTELFEVNLVPLQLDVRQSFLDKFTEFLFPPEPATETEVASFEDATATSGASATSPSSSSSGPPSSRRISRRTATGSFHESHIISPESTGTLSLVLSVPSNGVAI